MGPDGKGRAPWRCRQAGRAGGSQTAPKTLWASACKLYSVRNHRCRAADQGRPACRGGTSLYCVGSAVQSPMFHAMKAFAPPASARCGPTRPTRRSGNSRRTWRWFASRAGGFHLAARHGDGFELAGRRSPGHYLQLPRPFEPGSGNGRIDLAGNGACLSRHVRAQGAEGRVRTARVAEAWWDETSGDTVDAVGTPRREMVSCAGIHSACTSAGVGLPPTVV